MTRTSTLTRAADAVMEATVVPSFSKIGIAVRRRLYDWTPLARYDGTGLTAVLTGGNSGLGLATAKMLAARNVNLLLFVRSDEKGERTLDQLRGLGDGNHRYEVADLADLDSVRAFADRVDASDVTVDLLIHNAGAMFEERKETDAGIEMTFAVHVVGPFLLTALLLPRLADAAPSRVITVTSGGMYAEKLAVRRIESPTDYRPTAAYARAKRAQVVLTRQWAQRFGDAGIRFHTMHPGWADTPGVERSLPGFRKVMGPILRDAEQGADTTAWLALAPEVDRSNGRLWLDRAPRSEHKLPRTRHEAAEEDRLWAYVAQRAGIEPTLER